MDYSAYTMFMEEYFDEGVDEMNDYLRDTSKPPKDKSEVYKVNYYMRDHLQIPYISSQLKKSKIRDSIIEVTGRYIDNHIEQLTTSGPVYPISFGEKDIQPIYDLFGVNTTIILNIYTEMEKDTYFGKLSKFLDAFARNSPHKIFLTALIIDSLQNGYDDIIECCEYMYAFTEYGILYREYFKTGVQKPLMDYTIEHLGSKFVIKTHKLNDLKALLKYDAHMSVSFHADKLKQGVDHAYIDLMYRMRTQINAKLRNISNAYYDNHLKDATEHSKGGQFDDGSLTDQEGHTTTIATIVDKTTNKIIMGGVNAAHARAAAQVLNIDKDNLIGYLNQIYSDKNNMLPKFIEDVIQAYFTKYPTNTDIIKLEFFDFGMKLFRSIGTSKDETYQEIRMILDHWMFKIINIRQFYTREATISNYTRAIFNYMIHMIISYN